MPEQRETIKYDEDEDMFFVISGRHPDFEKIKVEFVEKTRWSVEYRVILKRKADGKLFAADWSQAATENQDSAVSTELCEVFERQVIKTEYY